MENINTLKVLVIGIFLRTVGCRDHNTNTLISHTARLPCGSTSKPFPVDASRVFWYRGTVLKKTSRILNYKFSDDTIRYNNHSSSKYDCSSDRALIVTDVTTEDEGAYTCTAFGSITSYMFIVELKTYEPPVLEFSDFAENIEASMICSIAIEHVGDISFTITVDPDYNVTSDNGTPDESGQVIVSTTILPHRRHNEQNATCTAAWKDNTTFQVKSSEEIVKVKFTANNITMTQSPSGAVTENTNETFTCVTDEAEPTAEVVWTVAGSERTSGISNTEVDDGQYNAKKRRSELTVRMDRTLNGQTVECHVSGKSEVRDTEILDVRYAPDSVSINASHGSAGNVGDTRIMTCTAEANPDPEITLYRLEGSERKKVGDSATSSLSQTITMTKEINRQNFVCTATSSNTALLTYSKESEKKNYTVQFSATSISMTQSPPGSVTENTDVTFTCVADEAQPTAEVVWTVGGSDRSSDSRNSVEEGQYNAEKRRSELTVRVDRTLNGQTVQCHVKNSTVRDTMTLDVRYPPDVEVANDTVSIVEGEEISLHCEISNMGNPANITTFSWSFQPKYNGSNMCLTDGSEMNLTLPQVEKGCSGIHSCTAGNGVGNDTAHINVTVQYSPKLQNGDGLDYYSVLNKSITLNLTVMAYPGIMEPFNWTLPGETALNTPYERHGSLLGPETFRSHFVIDHVKNSDYGNYTVAVANDIGNGSFTVRLHRLSDYDPSQIVSNTTPSGGSFPAVAVGAVMAVLAVIIAIVIGVVLFLRLKRNRSKETGGNIAETPYEDTGFNLPLVPSKTGIKDDRKSIHSENESDPALPPRHGLPPVLPRKSTKNSHADKSVPALPEHQKGKSTKNVSADKSIPALPDHQKEIRIPKDDFGKHYAKMVTTNKFKEEFDRLPTDPIFPTTYGALPDLKKKNRFKNMLPYDCNRVLLSEVDGNQLSSYINASFIKSYNGDVAYIATIGCTKESMDDFWRMMWEENASVIVMVTNLKEKGKTKCEKYWPDQDVCERYGSISVILEKTNYYADYEVKYLSMEKDNERRELTHYHYTGWPDKDVPRTAAAILKIRDHVKEHRTEGRTPIVVHCSAGIGRTGTFISIDYLLDQVEAEGVVDVVSCVTKLRVQRHFMVQTEEQYRFVYQVLSEAISVGSTALPCSDLGKMLFTLISDGSLEKQFEVLQVSRPVFTEEETEFATLFGNDRKNRSKDIVPADENRVLLESFLEDYINAVYIDGYKSPRSYIVTQIPMDLTLTTFWRMMMDHKCAAIVCLQDDPNSPQWCPQDNKSIVCGPFLITNSGERRKDGVLMSAVTLALSPESENTYANVAKQKHVIPWDKDEQHNFKVFHVTDWTKQPVKERSIPVLRQLYSQIQQWQHQCDNKRVVLMCLNGADECGLAVAAFNLFDMANTEQEVDIFNLVKQIRLPRPQFIASSDQYIFLHEAVQEYISQFGTYSNFR